MIRARVLAVLAAVMLSSCAHEPEAASGAPAPAGSAEPVSLGFEHRDGRGGVLRATLRCPSGRGRPRVGGYLGSRGAAALCRRARGLGRLLAARPDASRPCTLVYGGPQTARVRGTLGPRRVDRRLSRTDGCAISDWDRLGPLLPPVRSSPMPVR